MSEPTPNPPAVPDPADRPGPVDYTDDGVPTFEFVRDRIEGRAATAAAAEELAGGDSRAREAEDAYADRERKAADRLEEIRRSMGR
jgi:phage shock protein A